MTGLFHGYDDWRRAELFEEGRLKRTASTRGRVRVDDADPDPELGLGDLNRQLEIRVVRDHDGDLAVALKGVEQQVGGEVDVGALLLGLHDLDRARAALRRVRERVGFANSGGRVR